MQSKIKVLLIDDDPTVVTYIQNTIQKQGCTVTGTARNYDTAIMELNNFDCDVVLLDIGLKGRKTGLELGKVIYNNYRKPYIFLTSDQDNSILTQAIDAMPSGYVAKPFNPIALMVTLHAAMRYYSGLSMGGAEKEFKSSFFIKMGGRFKRMDWKEIVYLRSEKRHTYIFNAGDKREYPIRSTLIKTLKDIVPQQLHTEFIQINRAEAVQISHITELFGDEIKTHYNTMYVSDGYSKQLKSKATFLM